MKEPVWLKREWIDALHFQQLKRFGGLYGVRDEGAIESALAWPINQWADDQAKDLAALAAAYGFGLARSHGYSDGNKRISLVAMAVFLELNSCTLEASEIEVVAVMLSLAGGNMSEESLASWLRAHIRASSDT